MKGLVTAIMRQMRPCLADSLQTTSFVCLTGCYSLYKHMFRSWSVGSPRKMPGFRLESRLCGAAILDCVKCIYSEWIDVIVEWH